ncbi:MAG: hydrogenase 3 maturation endopeptidase HyCI [Anaerolineaceae bacterium]|nr:hydrogenase 3 maturation endopeptidase HyCI [Anaerolineaceae bacterium]
MGVGNELRGDDAAGVLAVRKLLKKKEQLDDVLIIEGAQAPENFTSVIRRFNPHLILIIDAGDFGADPGVITLIEPDEAQGGMGTHGLSLGDFLHYLQLETGSKTAILAIQAAGNEFGDSVCPPVKQAVNQAANKLHKLLIKTRIQESS